MKIASLAATLFAVVAWLILVLNNMGVAKRLSHSGSPISVADPFLLVPLAGLLASVCLSLVARRLPGWVGLVLGLLLLLVASFFLIVVKASRAG